MIATSFPTYKRFVERYTTTPNNLPWDDPLPPPEVIDLVPQINPGWALDLGCGYGRTARYLAQHDWKVDAVDFVGAAVEGGRRLARQNKVSHAINFHQASVTNLNFLRSGRYDLAVDIGCMHSFDSEKLIQYRDEVARLLRPAASYLLYAHFRTEIEGRTHGIEQEQLEALFADQFHLLCAEYGQTVMEDRPIIKSAWYWYQRL